MSKHVVVGSGGIGRGTALQLVDQGHQVILVSRSGGAVDHSQVTPVALDLAAADAVDRLAGLAAGAESLVNAVNPPYTRWATDWPPMAAALLGAAERSGAGLVTISNLYGYGHVAAPMVEGQPAAPNGVKGAIRSAMWDAALAAHEAGRIRATELRASDYFGPLSRQGQSYLGQYVLEPAAAGRAVWLIMGEADAPHSWSYLDDITAAAAALATSGPGSETWGRVWHAPADEPRSIRQVVADVAELVGRTPVPVRKVPARALLRRLVPLARELNETAHQFERAFILDSARTQQVLGLAPTPWRAALAETLGVPVGSPVSA